MKKLYLGLACVSVNAFGMDSSIGIYNISEANRKSEISSNQKLAKEQVFTDLMRAIRGNRFDEVQQKLKWWVNNSKVVNFVTVVDQAKKRGVPAKEIEWIIRNHQEKEEMRIKSLVNMRDDKGYTPLGLAIRSFNYEIAKYLINCGADINMKDAKGYTPLGLAINIHNNEIAKYLINCGADINMKDDKGDTPLGLAIRSFNYEIAKYLINCGADINMKDDKGDTPLGLAINIHNNEIAEYLINCGADINMKDDKGDTPLMIALSHLFEPSSSIDPDFIKYMLDKGADVNIRNNQEETPYSYFKRNFEKYDSSKKLRKEFDQKLKKIRGKKNYGEKILSKLVILEEKLEKVGQLEFLYPFFEEAAISEITEIAEIKEEVNARINDLTRAPEPQRAAISETTEIAETRKEVNARINNLTRAPEPQREASSFVGKTEKSTRKKKRFKGKKPVRSLDYD